MKVLFFINTNIAIGAGIEKTLINYVINLPDNDITVVQSQFYKIRRLDPEILKILKIRNFTIKDFEHAISFLKNNRITIPLYQFLLPFVVRFTKFYNRKILAKLQDNDVVYLFKNEYWPLFHGKIVLGSNHGQFAFDNLYTKILSLLIRSGIIYRGIDAFHLFPKSAKIGILMKKKFFIVPIGIPTNRYIPEERIGQVKVLFVGRLEFIKGIDIFLEISKRFKDDLNVTFHVAGSGSYKERMVAENSSNVVYHGILSDEELAELYGSCDIFLYPTRWDAFPSVILEASSSGEYIITSNRIMGVFDDLLAKGYLEYLPLESDIIVGSLNRAIKEINFIRLKKDEEHKYVAEKYDNSVVTRELYRNFQELLSEG